MQTYRISLIRPLTVFKDFIVNYSKATANMNILKNPVEVSIKNKLSQLNATYLDVINESYMHNVPEGSETHFKVVVVSDRFKDLPLIQRHRLINDILKDELKWGVHALSIVAKTPEQWQENKEVEPTPNCRGGFGK